MKKKLRTIRMQYFQNNTWFVKEYSCIRIYRNKYWWSNNIDLIKDFWKKIEFYRENDTSDLIKSKSKINNNQKNIINKEYDFIIDPD